MNYKTKTVIAGFLGLAMALTMVAVVGGVSSAQASFDANLTVGSTGADVSALQTWLIENGFLNIPAATGTFGPLTKAAVAAYQTSVGITPAAGYVGPITRAKLNAGAGGSVSGNFPAGCTSNSGFSSTTGMSCAGSVVPGCTAGAQFSSTTGMSCNGGSPLPAGCSSTSGFSVTTGKSCSGSTTGGSVSGGSGDITITKASDVESEVKEGDSNVKIANFKVKAEDSDVSVSSVKVTLFNFGSGSTRLNRYADEVTIWEGSKQVGSANVADFTKDGNNYSKSIALSGATVSQNEKVDFFVAVTAVAHIDGADSSNDWNVSVNQVRFEDGSGAILTADVPSSLDFTSNHTTGENFEFQTLANSGNVTMHISTVGPTAGDVTVSDTGTTSDVPLLYITLRAEGSDMTFSTLKVDLNSTGVTTDDLLASNLRLVEGKNDANGNEIDSETVAASADQTVTFTSSDDITIPEGSTKTYTVFGKIKKIADTTGQAGFDQGDSLTVNMSDPTSSSNFNIQDKNGDTANTQGSASGENQTFKSQGVTVVSQVDCSPLSDCATYNENTTATTSDDTATFVIPFTVTANDETVYLPLTGTKSATALAGTEGVTYDVQTSAGASAANTSPASAVEEDGSQAGVTFLAAGCQGSVDCLRINDGSTANMKLTVTYDPSSTNYYRLQIVSVNFATTTGAAADTVNAVNPVQDYRTSSIQIKN
ncbi:MAG: peptidoglycan-binding protein [Candidatus Pacebacteria bacterium]|nr:peptidoglycan-binding protein [Candidatus Paceibacterota bacterium]